MGLMLLLLLLAFTANDVSASTMEASSSFAPDSASLLTTVSKPPVWEDSPHAPPPGSAMQRAAIPRIPMLLAEANPPPEGWFYHQLPYGSDALVHPLRLIINGGFGILQFDNRDNRLSSVDFENGWRAVTRNVRHPVRAIETEGWWDFLQREVIPISFNANQAQYWPNYTLHLIGGGMSYTMMREWYQAQRFPRPTLWAGTTLAAYHLLNEVVENDRQLGTTTDPVADLLLFDPASIVLFSHEGVNAFFSRRMHLSDWSGQPAIDPEKGTIENHGQNFSIKLGIPRAKSWSFFYYFGNHGEGGLSYRRGTSAYSLAVGMRARELVDLEDNTLTTRLAPSVGLFYDRNGSLLFSAQWANTTRYRWKVNAYPGFLRVGAFSPGLFVNANKNDEVLAGIMIRAIPIGLTTRVSP